MNDKDLLAVVVIAAMILVGLRYLPAAHADVTAAIQSTMRVATDEPVITWNTPPSHALLELKTSQDIIIHGDGKGGPLAIIHANGKVDVRGDADEAARVFWRAIGAMRPTCREEVKP